MQDGKYVFDLEEKHKLFVIFLAWTLHHQDQKWSFIILL